MSRARLVTSTVRSRAETARHAARRRRDPAAWSTLSPSRVHIVPARVIDGATSPLIPEALRGRRHPGDWDRTAVPIDTLQLTEALRRRFVGGAAWEETGLHEAGIALAAARLGVRYLAMDPDAVRERGAALDALHASLQRDGWLPHHAIGSTQERELAIAIARDGRLLRNRGGLHRLILARILDLDAVPIRVHVEHALLDAVPDVLGRP